MWLQFVNDPISISGTLKATKISHQPTLSPPQGVGVMGCNAGAKKNYREKWLGCLGLERLLTISHTGRFNIFNLQLTESNSWDEQKFRIVNIVCIESCMTATLRKFHVGMYWLGLVKFSWIECWPGVWNPGIPSCLMILMLDLYAFIT